MLVAVAYTAVGRLSYTLAIPPGFAVPIWPAAGVALVSVIMGGYRYLPAVFLGAVAANLILSIETSADEPFITALRGLETASLISLGVMLQTAFAAYLVRRFMPEGAIPPSNYHDVSLFLLLGAVIGSVVSCTIGTATLYFYGIIPPEVIIPNYTGWWVGDAIGVALISPLLFLLMDRRNSLLRKFIVVVPSAIFVLLVIVAFFTAKEYDKSRQQAEIDNVAMELSQELEEELQTYLNLLTANERFILSSEYVSDDEFELFTRQFFKRYTGLAGMGWLPKVTKEQRASHERSIQEQGYENFTIKRRFDYGRVDTSEEREVYFPITYVHPYSINKNAHGLDVYGVDPLVGNMRVRSLDAARDEAQPKATGRFPIVQAENQYGFIVYHPVFSGDVDGVSISKRQEALIGYCNGIFTFPDLMSTLSEEARSKGFDVILKDVLENGSNKEILFDSRTSDYKEDSSLVIDKYASQAHVRLSFAGRIWEISFIHKHMEVSNLLWWLLIIGLLLSCGFSLFLIWLSGHVEAVQKEIVTADIKERTTAGVVLSSAFASIFLVMSFYISEKFESQEEETVNAIMMEEMDLIKKSITDGLNSTVIALRRMAQRWEVSGGTPKEEWAADARNYISDFPALTTVEWVNDQNIIEWVEPLRGNEKALGLNIAFDEKRRAMLEGAKVRGHITMTPPFQLVQGYKAFVVYISVYREEKFEGFIVGIFDTDKFVRNVLPAEQLDNFHLLVRDGESIVFESSKEGKVNVSFASELSLKVFGRKWSVILSPKGDYLGSKISYVALFTQVTGVLFSLLIGFAIYTALISHQRNKLAKRKSEELAESEAKLQAIMDNTIDGLITIDREGTVQSYNKACEQIFGYMPSEVIGKNIKMLMPENIAEKHDLYMDNYQQGKSKKGMIGFAREVEAKRKNGELFPVEISVSEVMTPEGMIYSGIMRDITERKKMIETLMNSNEELERFAYVCSHDLQEPLRMVSSFTEKLKDYVEDTGVDKDEKGQRYMNFVVDGAKRAQELIQDILAYSKLDRDAQRHEPVDLNELIKLVQETIQVSLEHTGGEVTYGDLPVVLGNKTQIYQLLQNLIGNGLKYQNPETKPSVDVSVKEAGDFWQVSIKDNGIGMEERHLKQIFEVFKRLHRKDEFPGTGIGLSVCKKIVERHGGQIWVESKKGQGSTFHFTLMKGEES